MLGKGDVCVCSSVERTGRMYFGYEQCFCGGLITALGHRRALLEEARLEARRDFLRGRRRVKGGLRLDGGSSAFDGKPELLR